MVTVGFCGEWFVFTCDKKLVAVDTKRRREPFVFDCSAAEKRPKSVKDDSCGDGGSSEETGSDKVLAFSVSPSGKLLALTDDTKRLVLLAREPAWRCISTRWVVRRCMSLAFSRAEDELLAADKSGDVYSFSVVEPQREGELKMGHLSMLLAMTTSPDDKYVITADRDEKIRVSHFRCPYNIQSFCLGHQQFVSALLILPAHSQRLLSGSGDGTVKLWDYESGRRLHSWDLAECEDTESPEPDKHKTPTVCRLASSPDGRHIAVQCERSATLRFLTLERECDERLAPHGSLSLPHCPLDMTFDPEGRLWVVLDSDDAPLRIYTHRQGSWECEAENPELSTVTEAFRPCWETLETSSRTSGSFEHLFKVGFDNVQAYQQKKQQRLEEQRLKRSGAPGAERRKKAKKEAS